MPTISATAIAEALNLNDVQVRKDLAAVSSSGKPKIGYVTADLIEELESFLGYNSQATPYWRARANWAGRLCPIRALTLTVLILL